MADKYTSYEEIPPIEEVMEKSSMEVNAILVRPEHCMFCEEMVDNYARDCILKLRHKGMIVVGQNKHIAMLDGKKCFHYILYTRKNDNY